MPHSILGRSMIVMAFAMLFPLALLSQEIKPEIQEAINSGDFQSAAKLLNAEIVSDPSYHLNYFLLGKVYLDAGDYNSAKEQFVNALDKKKKHYESLYYLSISLIHLDQLDEAEKQIKKGLKKAKKFRARFQNAQGLLLLKRKKYNDADLAFRSALAESEKNEEKVVKDIENAPYPQDVRDRLVDSAKESFSRQNASFHMNLGDANYYSGIPSLAVIEYEKALKVDSGSTEVFYHWAEACLEIPDYQCAIEKLQIVLAKDSTHASAWKRAGSIYYKAARSLRTAKEREQRFIESIGSYERYLSLSNAQPDSSTVRVFFELAMAYSGLNRFADAVPYYEKVLSIPFEPKDIYFNYGKALFWTKNYPKASETLLKHIQWASEQDEDYRTSVKDYELNRLLGDSYFFRKPKDYSNAVKYYIKSLESRPDQKRLIRYVAISYHYLKSYAQAIEYYDKRIALGLDSTNISIYKNAGYCALNIANGQGDEEDLDILDEDFGEEVAGEGEADLSGVNPDTNYYEIAIGYLKKYLEFKPKDKRALLLAANTYLYQMSDCTNGVAYFEKLLEVEPDNCSAMRALGYAYFSGLCTINYTKALKYLTQAYDCFAQTEDGPCSDKEISKWIAKAYHLRAASKGDKGQSDYKNANEWYGKCLKCNPGDAECKKGKDDTSFEF